MTRAASPREIARIFSVGPAKVYEAIRGGYVDSHRLGRKSLILVSDFEQYIRSLPPTRSTKPEAHHA